MSSDKGWYLVAAGVLALALGNSLARLDGQWARDLVAQGASGVQQVVSRADSYLAMAEMIFGGSDHSWTRAFHRRLELVSGQAQMARYRAEVTRAQMERGHGNTLRAGHQRIIRCASMNNAHATGVFISSTENF
jgi:hypothetical protein